MYLSRRLCFLLAASVAVGGLLMVTSCSKKPKPTTEIVKNEPAPPPPAPQPEPAPAVEPAAEIIIEDVFFDYDKYNIRNDALSVMERNARVLSNNAGARVLLEGHCDERGTVEYNLALGDRRAQSAKNYLVQFGIDPSRLSTISFGEEKPFVEGHDEAAWSKNRRVHFVIQK